MEALHITRLFCSILIQSLPNFRRYQTAVSLTDSSHENSDVKFEYHHLSPKMCSTLTSRGVKMCCWTFRCEWTVTLTIGHLTWQMWLQKHNYNSYIHDYSHSLLSNLKYLKSPLLQKISYNKLKYMHSPVLQQKLLEQLQISVLSSFAINFSTAILVISCPQFWNKTTYRNIRTVHTWNFDHLLWTPINFTLNYHFYPHFRPLNSENSVPPARLSTIYKLLILIEGIPLSFDVLLR